MILDKVGQPLNLTDLLCRDRPSNEGCPTLSKIICPHPSHSFFTLTLTLPAHLQPLIQDAARTKGMSIVDWATVLLESEAKVTCTEPSLQPKSRSQSK